VIEHSDNRVDIVNYRRQMENKRVHGMSMDDRTHPLDLARMGLSQLNPVWNLASNPLISLRKLHAMLSYLNAFRIHSSSERLSSLTYKCGRIMTTF